MRVVVKKRLFFLTVAIIIYTLGFQLLPQTLNYNGAILSIAPVLLASCSYFIVLPLLYWLLIIKAGKQKAWKMLIIFSTSSAMARYSFPADIAQYFEFVAWIKYPLVAILLVLEFYLMITIIKGLWQARKLSGDPRIHVLAKYKDDDKKLTLALPLAWEPTSWYYAIAKFSKNHAKNITDLVLLSASRFHYFFILTVTFLASFISYYLLISWSEIAAILVSGFLFYGVVFLTANYRISRHYSLYVKDKQLIINSAFLGFMVIDLQKISRIEIGQWGKKGSNKSAKKEDNDILVLGRGKTANIELTFVEEQTYVALMGMFVEKINKVKLIVAEPQKLVDVLQSDVEVKLAI